MEKLISIYVVLLLCMVLLFSSVHALIFLLFYHDIVKNTIVFFASSSISSGLVINIFNIFLNIAFSKISWIFYDLYQPPTNVCIYLVLNHGNSSDDQMITLFTFFLKDCGVVGRTARPVGTYVGLKLTPFAGICSTIELPIHMGQIGSVAIW